jgi:TRAP-type uncharacterized transport system fused permease subunit
VSESRAQDPPGGTRWIETRRGGLFFVNALLIFPYVMVLVPLATRTLVRARGGLPEASEILDTFPILAEHLLPRIGWMILVPLALVIKNLGIEEDPRPRAALWGFLGLHLLFVAWTVGVWVGAWEPLLPGAP